MELSGISDLVVVRHDTRGEEQTGGEAGLGFDSVDGEGQTSL